MLNRIDVPGRRRVITVILAVLALAPVAIMTAQRNSSYGGSSPLWWDAGTGAILAWEEGYDNPEGLVSVLNTNGVVRTAGHPFFEALGTNGRACITCHQPSNAMSLSVATLRRQWTATNGADPVFAAVDGSNCPDLPQAEMSSHSLLLDRGLFRIALPWPPKTASGNPIKPDFRIEIVSDPGGCNHSPVYGLLGKNHAVSVYRRPRIAANLKYVVSGPSGRAFMSDAREPSLRTQAISAVMTHEEAQTHPTEEQLRKIVDFETQVFAAQSADTLAGLLTENDGPLTLGPQNLQNGRAGTLHVNTPDPSPAWLSFNSWRYSPDAIAYNPQFEFRASVARGSDVFFGRKFRAEGSSTRTCASCHAAGITRWMDVGTTNRPAATASPDLPLFRITCDATATPHPSLGRVIYTQDPGRALISGKCADVGSIVMPQFRGLAARAPYFSNGSARTINEVVEYYDRRFVMALSALEKKDLANFLRVL